MRLFRHVSEPLFLGDQVLLDAGTRSARSRRTIVSISPVIIFIVVGLARAVGSQVSGDFSGARAEADAIHREAAGESLRDVPQFQHRAPPVFV